MAKGAKKAKISSAKRKAIQEEIRKLVREYKETGKMETSRATYRPKSVKHAQKIAAAVAYGKHKVGRAGKGRRK